MEAIGPSVDSRLRLAELLFPYDRQTFSRLLADVGTTILRDSTGILRDRFAPECARLLLNQSSEAALNFTHEQPGWWRRVQ